MKLHSRGAHPPRLDFPPLNDETWELIRRCWVREASKRPGIEEVTKRMAQAPPEAEVSSEKPDDASNKRRKIAAKHICPVCSKALSTKQNLTSPFLVLLIMELSIISLFSGHMETHDIKNQICEPCGKGFTSQGLRRHIRVCKKRKGQMDQTKDVRVPSPPEDDKLYYDPFVWPGMHLSFVINN